jgi:colanic acid/amylovoran biosynthesis glycosyltransferase
MTLCARLFYNRILNSGIRLAYLVSQYPTAGHAFILREIHKLRELGFDIHVASIRAPDRPPDAEEPPGLPTP